MIHSLTRTDQLGETRIDPLLLGSLAFLGIRIIVYFIRHLQVLVGLLLKRHCLAIAATLLLLLFINGPLVAL